MVFQMLKYLWIQGATNSFISNVFKCKSNVTPCVLLPLLALSIADGDTVLANKVMFCVIGIESQEFLVDFIALGIQDFDVILGMEWHRHI